MVDRTPRSLVGRAVGVVRGTGAMAGWRPRPRGASVLTYHDVDLPHDRLADQFDCPGNELPLCGTEKLGVEFA